MPFSDRHRDVVYPRVSPVKQETFELYLHRMKRSAKIGLWNAFSLLRRNVRRKTKSNAKKANHFLTKTKTKAKEPNDYFEKERTMIFNAGHHFLQATSKLAVLNYRLGKNFSPVTPKHRKHHMLYHVIKTISWQRDICSLAFKSEFCALESLDEDL